MQNLNIQESINLDANLRVNLDQKVVNLDQT